MRLTYSFLGHRLYGNNVPERGKSAAPHEFEYGQSSAGHHGCESLRTGGVRGHSGSALLQQFLPSHLWQSQGCAVSHSVRIGSGNFHSKPIRTTTHCALHRRGFRLLRTHPHDAHTSRVSQDPFFRLTRDIANALGYLKPCLLHSKFFPALQGAHTKMNASDPNSAVFVTDTPAQISTKVLDRLPLHSPPACAHRFLAHRFFCAVQITTHAFSGGGVTAAEHKAFGGNTDIDVSYQGLKFFLDDHAKLAHIRSEYSSGRMGTKTIKQNLIDTIAPLVLAHQTARAKVTDPIVEM